MKRVGTVSSALGFIFLGIWMMIDKINPNIAKEVFKWWPVIFIIFGLEILFYFGKKKDDQRVGFNFILILIVLIFLGIDIYKSTTYRFDRWPDHFKPSGIIMEYSSDNFNILGE